MPKDLVLIYFIIIIIVQGVSEEAIQDACEELQNEPEINQMLESLSHVHDEFLIDMSGSMSNQEGLPKHEIDRLLDFMRESTAKSMYSTV